MPTPLTPLKELRVSTHLIPAFNRIPNTSLSSKPLLIYHSCFASPNPSSIESHLTALDVCTPHWRYTMYSTTHFHSTTHELLSVYAGSARLCFGDESNPRRVETTVRKGDVIVIPAGVGHRLLEDLKEEGESFGMVGAYPKDAKGWDMCYGRDDGEEGAEERIRGLGWFRRDPIYGDEGPVLEV